MLTTMQQATLTSMVKAAQTAGHIYPGMAGCEAVLESAWGTSQLAKEAFNVFGMKQHQHPIFKTISIPTREFLHATWITVDAQWVEYPDIASCFADRMTTLRTLSMAYPSYCLALASDTAEEYVTEVSRNWSTDPNRAASCIEIYHAHSDLISAALAT